MVIQFCVSKISLYLFLTDDINSDICRFVSLSSCLERQGLQNLISLIIYCDKSCEILILILVILLEPV